MKNIIFLLLVFIGLDAFAQSEYFYFFNAADYEAIPLNRKSASIRKKNHVKTMTEMIVVYKKGKENIKKNKKIVSSFDENGRLILTESFNSDDELVQRTTYVLNDSGLVLEKKITNAKGKILYQLSKTYNPEGMIIDYTFISNGKVKSRYTTKYDGKLLIERSVFKKDGTTLKSRLEYIYQTDGQLKITRQYNGKGMITHTWNHECLPEGQLLEARKDTTTICQIKEDLGNGRFVTYTKNVDEKGVLSTTTTWMHDDRMLDSTVTKKEGKHPKTFVYKSENNGLSTNYFQLDENGDTIYKAISIFSAAYNSLLQENYIRSKKNGGSLILRGRNESEEDSNGLLINNRYYMKGVLYRQSNYTYTFF